MSTLALERVIEISEYLAFESEERAERWVEALFAYVKELEHLPNRGRIVPELKREEIREIFFESYRVVYKVKTEQVDILTIRHMRQLLDEDDIEG